MAKKKTKLDKMSKKEKTSLAYALATNLAKHGKPQTPKNERQLTKGEEKKKEKHVMKFKKAFDLEEIQSIMHAILNTRPKDKDNKKPYKTNAEQLPKNYNFMTGKFTEQELKNPKKADLNKDGKLSSYEKKRGAAIEKAIQKEHHLEGNPDAKYVATAAPQGWFDVWEGEPFDITGEKGVLVGKFKTMKDAKDYANIKNGEQGKLEAPKNYLQEDANKIIALEKERERLMADMEQEAEPGGGPIADEYGVKLDRIDKALAKLKGSKKQYGVLSTAELNKLARIKR